VPVHGAIGGRGEAMAGTPPPRGGLAPTLYVEIRVGGFGGLHHQQL
jgi:hypothetical protein